MVIVQDEKFEKLERSSILDKAVEQTVIENRPLLRATQDHGRLRVYRSLQSVITHYKLQILVTGTEYHAPES